MERTEKNELAGFATIPCRYCLKPVYFSKYVLHSRTQKPLPLNPENSAVHHCKGITINDEALILQCLRYVTGTNDRLKSYTLSLIREAKEGSQ